MEKLYKRKIKSRAQEMVSKIGLGKNGFQKSLIWVANKFYIRNKAAKAFLKVVEEDMKEHGLLK